jgi:PKD repeat protein
MRIGRVSGFVVASVAALATGLAVPSASLAPATAATPLCGAMAGTAPHVTKVLWIAMENESYGTGAKAIPGSPSASYIKSSLVSQCGSTSNYHAVTHPSYPNYLAMTSGSTQGVTGDTRTYVSAPSVFSQVDPSWRSYEEFMPVNCDHIYHTGSNPPSQYYLGRHNPAASYSALPVGAPKTGDCTTNDVPLGTTTSGALQHDVSAGALPKFSLITPGLCDDMHALPAGDTSCPDLIKGGDNWLSTWIPILTSGPDYTSGNLVIDVVWDEGRGGAKGEDCTFSAAADCIVPNIVISPYTTHVLSPTNFSHYSLLKTTEELLGVPLLGHAGDASTTDMCGPFGICAQPAGPPSAAFTSTCTGLSCSFDGRGSTAPGSSIAGYSWTFGDGSSGSTATPSHSYAAGGSYAVTLTVTNAQGLTGSITHQVSVSSGTPAAIGFVAATGTTKNAATETVTVPSAVQPGNEMLLTATGVTTSSLSAPAGWTLVGSTPNPVMTTAVWSRVATAADPGSAVTVTFPAQVKGSVQLSAYSGTSTTAPVAGFASGVTHVNATQATTPSLAIPASGDWLVSYWTAKSSAITAWNVPSNAIARNSAIGTGGGQICSLIADSNTPLAAGPAGGLTATADQTFSASTTLSIALAPGS